MHVSLMIYEPAEGFRARVDPAERDAYWAGTMQFLQALKDSGILVAGAGLVPPDAARTLREPGGAPRVHDGPYADTKEQLGGFFILDVADMEVALAWAARFPSRPGVVIEVRPTLPND